MRQKVNVFTENLLLIIKYRNKTPAKNVMQIEVRDNNKQRVGNLNGQPTCRERLTSHDLRRRTF